MERFCGLNEWEEYISKTEYINYLEFPSGDDRISQTLLKFDLANRSRNRTSIHVLPNQARLNVCQTFAVWNGCTYWNIEDLSYRRTGYLFDYVLCHSLAENPNLRKDKSKIGFIEARLDHFLRTAETSEIVWLDYKR